MAVKKNNKLNEPETEQFTSEDREEYIRSLEISVQFLKNELERVNSSERNQAASPISNLDKQTLTLLDSNNEVELINKTHTLLSKYFSVVECNFFFKNEESNLVAVGNTDTGVFLNKQIEHLEEQGIIDWVFEEREIKIIPNLDFNATKQSSYIIYPVFQSNEPIGVFIAGTSMSQSAFEPSILNSLKNTLSIVSVFALNLINFQEKNELKRKFDIINNQLMQTSLLLSVGEIAGTISREMNNPLQIIKANTELILNGIGSAERRSEIISENNARLIYLNQIIQNLAFDDDAEQMPVDMKQLLEDTLDILKYQISKEDIKIDVAYDKNPIELLCHKTQMQHVLLNLFLNARDSMPNGGLLSIGCFRQGEKKFSISIADTGEGIPEADIPNIFEPHFSNKRGSKKLALNLYMTKRIITRHKGKISFVSEQGKGTTFKILLPNFKK